MNNLEFYYILELDYSNITYYLQPSNIVWALSLVMEKIITGVQRDLLIFFYLSESDLNSIPNSLASACLHLQPQVTPELVSSELIPSQPLTVKDMIPFSFEWQSVFCNGMQWVVDSSSLATGGLQPIEPPVSPEGPGNPFANTGPLGPTNTADSHTVTGKTVADYISNEKERIIRTRLQDPRYCLGQPGYRAIRDVRMHYTGIQHHPVFLSKLIDFAKSDVGKQMRSLTQFNESLKTLRVRDGFRDPSLGSIRISDQLITNLSMFR